MTAINVIRQRDAVHILTDGASWFRDGSLGPCGSKVWPVPNCNAVITARGPRLGAAMVIEHLSAAGTTYDSMKRMAPSLIQAACEMFSPLFSAETGGVDIEVVVAGFSERTGRPDSYVVSSKGNGAWSVVEAGPILMAPGDDDIQRRVLSLLPPGVQNADDMDPQRDGLTILEAQRTASGAEGRIIVGGFAQLTTITRGEIRTRILRSWQAGDPFTIDGEAA